MRFACWAQGEVDVDELPQDSLRRIKETYKQLKVVASSAAEEAASQLTALRAEAALAGAQAATVRRGSFSLDGVLPESVLAGVACFRTWRWRVLCLLC